MKLFCRYHWVPIGKFDLPSVRELPAVHDVYIVCSECGKYREVTRHNWMIIKSRQHLRNQDRGMQE